MHVLASTNKYSYCQCQNKSAVVMLSVEPVERFDIYDVYNTNINRCGTLQQLHKDDDIIYNNMNKLRLLQIFRDLGDHNEARCATAYAVFLDLIECQTLVDYYFDVEFQLIYFKQHLSDGKIDFIFPLTANEDIDLLRLHRICKKFCGEDNLTGVVIAIVAANSVVTYQRIGNKKVLDFRKQS